MAVASCFSAPPPPVTSQSSCLAVRASSPQSPVPCGGCAVAVSVRTSVSWVQCTPLRVLRWAVWERGRMGVLQNPQLRPRELFFPGPVTQEGEFAQW